MTFRSYFSDGFQTNEFGLITGSSGVQLLPNIPCSIFKLRTIAANKGPVYLGYHSGTVVFELSPGDSLDWIVARNLNEFYWKAPSGTSDQLAYWVQK
jgi:hypothetical protein